MRLKRVRIRNFRCFQDEVAIDLDDITAFVGANDAGKSTIFEALALFFDEYNPDADDASIQGDKADMRVVCEFEQLPSSLVLDATASTDLAVEHLLNANGRFEVHKVYNGSLKSPKLTATVALANHPTQDGFHDLLALKISELKQRAKQLDVDLTDVDTKVNTQLRRAIWAAATDLQIQSVEVPLDAEGAKKIWDQVRKQLPAFALFHSDRKSTDQDEEAQDPMKAAVAEALKAKQAELDTIAQHVEAEVRAIAEQTLAKLKEMDPTLASQLNPRFSTPSWAKVFSISLTDDAEIPINKRGSGVRRLILLNFFRAKAEQKAKEKDAPGVFYAIEEPETSQHPKNQKLLIRAFEELSEQDNCQIIISTHNPLLASLLPTSSLRYVEKLPDKKRNIHAGGDETSELVRSALGILPDNNVELFVGVEGVNDINFLKNISEVLRTGGEDVLDLAALEDVGKVVFVPVGGSNLKLWVSRLEGLNRPEFHLFDRDVPQGQPAPYQSTVDEINERNGCTALLTGKLEMENYVHPDAIAAVYEGLAMNPGADDDVPLLVAQAVHGLAPDANPWEELDDDKKSKKVSRAKQRLNAEAVVRMTPAMLDEVDSDGDVRGWLAQMAAMMGGPA